MHRFIRDVTRCRECPAWRFEQNTWLLAAIGCCELSGEKFMEEPKTIPDLCPLPQTPRMTRIPRGQG